MNFWHKNLLECHILFIKLSCLSAVSCLTTRILFLKPKNWISVISNFRCFWQTWFSLLTNQRVYPNEMCRFKFDPNFHDRKLKLLQNSNTTLAEDSHDHSVRSKCFPYNHGEKQLAFYLSPMKLHFEKIHAVMNFLNMYTRKQSLH